ncbi:MAG: PDZ domain-containing protein [Ornithinimicrobium sp.]
MAQPLTRPAHTGISGRAALALMTVVVLIAAVAILNLVNVPKVIYRPGPAYDALGQVNGADVVTVEGLPTYPTSGTLDFTTITLSGGPRFPVSAWEWLGAHFDSSSAIADERDVFPPDVTPAQVREQNLELMTDSQQQAAVVALRAIGEQVPEEVKVAQVLVDAPADGVLSVNDQIVAVGDQDIETPDELRDVLQEVTPGDEVDFTIVRDGTEQQIAVPTTEQSETAADGTTTSRTIIGIYPASDFELPYDIKVSAGNVGGPSAGLMFTLAIYDSITPGELTGGRDFAGTGTINSKGEVGPIGGIAQKMIGAQDAGADYFLAPADNCPDVVGNIPDGLAVAKVATFAEARDVVEAVGKDPKAPLPQC